MSFTQSELLNAGILIVDDQEANVALLQQLLQEAGYKNVDSTMDPKEVRELHAENGYDLILLDLQMPVMDGFEVMEGLKADLRAEKKSDKTGDYLPILVLTAQPGHKLRALQAGAKDFISKPFDLVEVKTRIHNMLEVRLLYKKLANYNRQLEKTVLERTAELRQSEARYVALTELASDWYWEQDAAGKFIKTSGPVLEVLGIHVDAAAAEKADAGQAAGWNEAERKNLQDVISSRQPFIDLVISCVRTNGSKQSYRVSGEPMFNESARFIGYRGIGVELRQAAKAD